MEHLNKIFFLLTPLLLLAIGLFFKKIQNKGKIVGGNISTPKALWLSYTIGSWFILPFIFYSFSFDNNLIYVITFHLISFYTRGLIELIMIYKWYNWSPLYGITHDIFHLVGALFLLIVTIPKNFPKETILILFYISSIIISTSYETIFSILFYKIRGKEKKKIYFASDSKEWLFVNRLTWTAVYVCYGIHFLNAYIVFNYAL